MARLVWIGVGAVGGIYAYRSGTRAVQSVREQGVARVAQIVAATAVRTVAPRTTGPQELPAGSEPGLRLGRYRITYAAAQPPEGPAAIMDREVVDITDAGRLRSGTPRRKAR